MDTGITTLVLSEPSATAEHLCSILREDGIPARQMSPGEVLDGWSSVDCIPDLLLVSAGLTVEQVREASRRIVRATNRTLTVVTFADRDVVALEPHVLAGLDYIVPPFLPSLVRGRIMACQARQEMAKTTEELQTAADLLKYERELQIGREIQQGFLPESLPRMAGWELDTRFHPAREVAGDFYDAFELLDGNRIGLVVADVCDKGVGAALFMALIRSLLRHASIHVPEDNCPDAPGADLAVLARAVDATNEYLTANHLEQGYFATLFFGVLDPDTGQLLYVNGGHNPPVLCHAATGDIELLAPTGPALGLVPGTAFGLGRAGLAHDDLLFVYTDGVTEARDRDGRFFTEQRMINVVVDQLGRSATTLLDRMEAAIDEHVGAAEQFDDITMLALRRCPAAPE